MKDLRYIDSHFIEINTDFEELVHVIKQGFLDPSILVPKRHHHDFPNDHAQTDSTLLLMPAWNSGNNAGVKIVTVSPENAQFDLPSIQGIYAFFSSKDGVLKSIIDAKSLTTKRKAATSALASSYLAKKNASSLLMIGTGALSKDLIKAHRSVRPIQDVFVWGRDFSKAERIASELKEDGIAVVAISSIEEYISSVDIVSCATLSKHPLVLGSQIREGQHIDLVGAYKPDMREADDELVAKASVFVDTFQGIHESGDIAIPLKNDTLKTTDIKGDLFSLTALESKGRTNQNEITMFKSVGHAIEDLVAAQYYDNLF